MEAFRVGFAKNQFNQRPVARMDSASNSEKNRIFRCEKQKWDCLDCFPFRSVFPFLISSFSLFDSQLLLDRIGSAVSVGFAFAESNSKNGQRRNLIMPTTYYAFVHPPAFNSVMYRRRKAFSKRKSALWVWAVCVWVPLSGRKERKRNRFKIQY